MNVGDIAFVTRVNKPYSHSISAIHFIRYNIIISISARGAVRSHLISAARWIDELLLKETPHRRLTRLGKYPGITDFRVKPEPGNNGNSVRFLLKIKPKGNLNPQFLWQLTNGGIRQINRNIFEYSICETGSQRVTVTVLNEVGLYDSKSVKVKIK